MRPRIASMYEPPARAALADVAATAGAGGFSAAWGKGRSFTKRSDRFSAARSCLRVRPGWLGKRPSLRGIVASARVVRSGTSASRALPPPSCAMRMFASSSPSGSALLGIVRAR